MNPSAFLVLGLVALPAVGSARPVRNSFVNRRVTDARGLLVHVQSDPEVADRYERHFAMDRGTLLAYLGGLHRGALAKAGYFTIYSVPDDGHLKMHVGRLPKGEPMFLDRNGTPILVVKCGNPVVLGPRHPRQGNPVALTLAGEGSARPLLADDSVPAAGDVLALTPEAAPVPLAEILTSTESAPLEAAPMAVGASTVPASAPGWGGVLVGLGGLSAASTSLGGHGGSSQPVPEPATLIALATGVGALARRRKR